MSDRIEKTIRIDVVLLVSCGLYGEADTWCLETHNSVLWNRDLIQSLKISEVAEYVRRLTEGLHPEVENGWRDKALTR